MKFFRRRPVRRIVSPLGNLTLTAAQRRTLRPLYTDPAEPQSDLYGVELDRRLALERTVAAVWEVVETYESCGPKQQSTRDVLAAVRAALGSEA